MNEPRDAHARQKPLRERYRESPHNAAITDGATTMGGVDVDPFHGQVAPGTKDYGVVWPFGIHAAVGGYHDAPNPGDMLCAALAACLDSTIRIVADLMRVKLDALAVSVTADVDVRGTLVVDRNVPVGFQKMRCQVRIRAAPGTDAQLLDKLIASAEASCVNMQTLRSGVAIETSVAASP